MNLLGNEKYLMCVEKWQLKIILFNMLCSFLRSQLWSMYLQFDQSFLSFGLLQNRSDRGLQRSVSTLWVTGRVENYSNFINFLQCFTLCQNVHDPEKGNERYLFICRGELQHVWQFSTLQNKVVVNAAVIRQST